MQYIGLCSVAAAILFSTGCTWGTYNSIYRHFDLGEDEAHALDVKQRVILTKQFGDPRVIACAEPSPDALQVLSMALAIEAATPEGVSGKLAASSSEGALSIGLRTQTIQILRDAMYRLCEGYFNGAIDGPEFKTAHTRYQNSMVALLAIEQLTGAVRPQLAVVGSSGEASISGTTGDTNSGDPASSTDQAAADAKAKAKAEAEKAASAKAVADAKSKADAAAKAKAEADGKAKTATEEKATAEKEAKEKGEAAAKTAADPKADADAKAKADAAKAKADAASKAKGDAATKARADADEKAKADVAAKANLLRASTKAGSSGQPPTPDASTAVSTAELATAVTTIVESVFKQDYYVDFCFAYLRAAERHGVTENVVVVEDSVFLWGLFGSRSEKTSTFSPSAATPLVEICKARLTDSDPFRSTMVYTPSEISK